MTTHGFEDLAKDPSVMRALVRENNGNLGVYARPIKTGRIQVGDAVVLLAN
jgi:MOSC domain-containing protein YiiM